jgi:PAS domain S-box-containing protein
MWFRIVAGVSAAVAVLGLVRLGFQTAAHRRLADDLARSRNLFRHIADATPDILYLFDLVENRNVYVNREIAEVLGYSPEQIASLGPDLLAHLIHPDDMPAIGAYNAAFSKLKSGGMQQHEYRMRHADGTYRWLQSRDVLFDRDAAGRPRTILGIAQDITDRKQVQQQLLRANDLLRSTLAKLAAEPEPDAFLGHLLALMTEELSGTSATLWLFNQARSAAWLHLLYEGGRIRAGRESRHPSACLDLADAATGFLAFLQDRNPAHFALVDGAITTPAQRAYLEAQGARALLKLSLALGDRLIGAITIRLPSEDMVPATRMQAVLAMAHQATLALEMSRLSDQRYGAAILDERNRIARDIHDTLAQSLSGIAVQLEAARQALGPEHAVTTEHLDRALGLARQSLVDARRSVHALRPDALGSADLATALASIAAQLDAIPRVRFVTRGSKQALSAVIEQELFHVGQEALANAVRHAAAHTVEMELAYEPNQVTLTVRDDGRGLSTSRPSDGRGLRGMRERSARIGARLLLDTDAGRGTTVTVTVPKGAES